MCLTKEFDLTLPRLHVFMTICPKILGNISNSSNAALSHLLPIHPHDKFLSHVPTQNKELSRITSLAVMLGAGSVRRNLFLLATCRTPTCMPCVSKVPVSTIIFYGILIPFFRTVELSRLVVSCKMCVKYVFGIGL